MKRLFLIPCVVAAVAVQASEKPVERVTPRLIPVEQTKDGKALIETIRPVAPARMAKAPSETVQRLDSVVGYNSDGSKGTLQTFGYDGNNWWVESQKYMWDGESWGEPQESFYCTRLENGFVQSEVNMAYGYGVRNDYEYDEDGNGISMTCYFYEGVEWTPTSKGEYEYDADGNIVEEYIYEWVGNDWRPVSHNLANWDEKHRQTSIVQNSWNGSSWQGITKVDYEWYDGPIDPDYVPGTEKERMTYRGEYTIIDGKWLLTSVTENFFNEDGRVSGQAWKYYNRQYDNWYGGDSFGGLFPFCTSWISEIGYDSRGVENLNRTYQYVPGPEEKLYELGHVEFVETPKENGDFEVLTMNIVFDYDADYNKIGERVIDKCWYGYNARGKKLAVYEEMPYGGDGPMVPILEDKWGYDEYGYLEETMSFDFDVEGNRIPANWGIERHDEDGNTIEIVGHTNGNSGGLQPMFTRGDESAPVYEREYCITDKDRNDNWLPTNRWVNSFENGMITDHIGYKWNGSDWVNNQGQRNYFDFSVSVDRMLVPQLYTDIYKVDRIEYLYGNGADWMSTNVYYHYSEQTLSAVMGIETENLMSFDGSLVRNLDGGDVMISVYDLIGSRCLSVYGVEADLSGLPQGAYVVTMATSAGRCSSMKVFRR